MDTPNSLLRHTLATLAYRAGKALRDAPDSFSDFRPAPGSRSPGEILAHMGDLFDWALTICDGPVTWTDSPPLPWGDQVARFFTVLGRLDARLAEDRPLESTPEKIFQGPIADALQHTGQLTYLRRLAGCPIKGESYFRSDIEVGRVGLEQAAPRREFD
jgi:hypothetical protein